MFDSLYNAAEKVKLWMSLHYRKLSLICVLFVCVVFSPTSYAVNNETVFLAPTSQTSIYFNTSISDGSILLTCKSTVSYSTPWEIVVSPPLSYADTDGDYYITFVNYRSYNPDVVFYNSNGAVINALSTKQITIDSLSYDTNAFVYKLPKTLAYIKVGGGGSGNLSVNQSVFMSAYFNPINSGNSIDDIIAAINSQTSAILSNLDENFDKVNDYIVNGDDNTSSVIRGLTSNLNDFNNAVNNINSFESDIIDYFNDANHDVQLSSNLITQVITSNTELITWFKDTFSAFIRVSDESYILMTLYITFPCIVGAVMFFVGRGGSILGGLYRKPTDISTTTVSTGYTVVDEYGIRRSESSTHTRGEGGIFRK